jgi:hypothetical protein
MKAGCTPQEKGVALEVQLIFILSRFAASPSQHNVITAHSRRDTGETGDGSTFVPANNAYMYSQNSFVTLLTV